MQRDTLLYVVIVDLKEELPVDTFWISMRKEEPSEIIIKS